MMKTTNNREGVKQNMAKSTRSPRQQLTDYAPEKIKGKGGTPARGKLTVRRQSVNDILGYIKNQLQVAILADSEIRLVKGTLTFY
jgi:hypothetical protein